MGEVRRRWTASEDALLWELYQIQEKAPTGKSQKVNWNEIARLIPGRSNKDCRKRYYNRFTGGLRKGSWTQDEDERLFQLVERYQYRWAAIAQKMETRNADQCSKRWHHCLNPELERSPWTNEDSTLLLSAVAIHGSSWKDIQRCHFPTRSANNIKNQYTVLTRKGMNRIPLRPCCDAPSTKLSSKRPPSFTPSLVSSHAATQDRYTYNPLFPPPQFSVNDYLPGTPDTSASLNGLDFHTSMPLNHDPNAFNFDYQTAVYMNGAVNHDAMAVGPIGTEYGIDTLALLDGFLGQSG
ncbi:Homeodomain-like protein [Aspergillus lucknowensis]|uniref:Homeodomain-like protein n=1 Tax=Aspergillus lucknowensis TaxID=176173 RepID=A0ABR4LWS7_9EURO